jgi:stage V sporulation protein R
VETFLDRCLSIDNLIDPHSVAMRRHPAGKRPEEEADPTLGRLPSKGYMDRYINPSEFLELQRRQKHRESEQATRTPSQPERDVLLFLLQHAPLKKWQQEILSMVREEAYYFAPQGQTKIMNEGWASYWHSTIMTQRVLRDSEIITFADHHSGTLATSPGRLNPYKVGIELFRDIEDRWNKGRFGREWEDCLDFEERRRFDRHLMQGREKIFEVRRVHNDITFIDSFLTQEFCDAHKLFVYRTNPRTGQAEIASRDHRLVKEQILFGLSNMGSPIIEVLDSNHENRGELYLLHRFEGLELDQKQASETLRTMEVLWGRPVHLESRVEQKGIRVSWARGEITTRELTPSGDSPRESV